MSTETTYALEPISLSRVAYPLLLRQQKIQGVVVGFILVSEMGDVEAFRTVKGDTVLGDFAEQAAKQWKFKPVTREGKSLPVISKVTFKFVLASDNQDPPEVVPDIGPAGEHPQRIRLTPYESGGFLASKRNPVYPPKAIAAHIQGTVTLQGVISKEGKVIALQQISGPPKLTPAAIDAVQQWLYRPCRPLGFRPVEVETQFLINFALRER